MRKFIQNVCIVSAIALLVCSCGFGGNKDKKKPTTYVEAISKNDFVTAHEILDGLLMEVIHYNAIGSIRSYQAIEEYWSAADHIYKAEMMYLIEMNDQSANKRLINTLASMNIIGDKPLVKTGYSSWADKPEIYRLFLKRYNLLCDMILDIALLNNNSEMARQVLSMYKEDVIRNDANGKYGKDADYVYTFSYQSRDAATKKYNDAIKNGLLN